MLPFSHILSWTSECGVRTLSQVPREAVMLVGFFKLFCCQIPLRSAYSGPDQNTFCSTAHPSTTRAWSSSQEHALPSPDSRRLCTPHTVLVPYTATFTRTLRLTPCDMRTLRLTPCDVLSTGVYSTSSLVGPNLCPPLIPWLLLQPLPSAPVTQAPGNQPEAKRPLEFSLLTK